MESRHPHLRYRVAERRVEARLRERVIAFADWHADGWHVRHVKGLGWSDAVRVDARDDALALIVKWARPYAWKHDHRPHGNVTSKGLRRRPT